MSPEIIPILNSDRYTRAKQAARAAILTENPEPRRDQFIQQTGGEYPRWLTAGMALALAVVAAGAFWLSAGKFIVSTDLALSPVLADGMRLSPGYLDVAILVALVFGEIGAILFSVGAAVFPARPHGVIFRLAAALSAALALIANVGVSAMHAREWQQIALFGWAMAVIPPLIVLVVGLLAERLILSELQRRHKGETAYRGAMSDWKRATEAPERHPDWQRVFINAVLDQYRRVSSLSRARVDALYESDPPELLALVKRTVARYELHRLAGDSLLSDGTATERQNGTAMEQQAVSKADLVRNFLRNTPNALNGMTVRDIADRTGTSSTTVQRVMQQMNPGRMKGVKHE